MTTKKERSSAPKERDSLYRLFTAKAIAVFAAVLALAWAIIACALALDPSSGYFNPPTVKYVFYGATVIAAATCIATRFLFPSGKKKDANAPTSEAVTPSPKAAKSVPDTVETAPKTTETVPDTVENASETTETVPDTVKTASEATEKVECAPNEVENEPEATETASDAVKNASKASETAPEVPVNSTGSTLIASDARFLFPISLLPGIAAALSLTLLVPHTVDRLTLILCLLSVFPLAFAAIPSRYFLSRAIAGCLQCAFIVIAIALLYFDMRIEINNPVKLFLQLGLASALLESLGEIRNMLGTQTAGAHVCVKSLALTLCATGGTVGCFAAFTCERFSQVYLCIALFLLCFAVNSGCSLLAAREK